MNRYRSAEEIEAMCRAQGLAFSRHPDTDAVRVEGGGAIVWYSPSSGEFHGTTPWTKRFNSRSSHLLHEAWHQALCEFFWEWSDPERPLAPL